MQVVNRHALHSTTFTFQRIVIGREEEDSRGRDRLAATKVKGTAIKLLNRWMDRHIPRFGVTNVPDFVKNFRLVIRLTAFGIIT